MNNKEEPTHLEQSYTFSFTYFKKKKNKQLEEFEDNFNQIATFSTAEDFWTIYEHTQKPNSLPRGSQFFLFKENIKPMWEDPKNQNGGRYVLSLKKSENCDKIWEELLINYIRTKPDFKVNGIVLNIRTAEIIFSIWIEKCNNIMKDCIKQWIKNSLDLPNTLCLLYKDHPKTEDVNKLQIKLDNEQKIIEGIENNLKKKQNSKNNDNHSNNDNKEENNNDF